MSGDPFRLISTGQRPPISARRENAISRAAQATKFIQAPPTTPVRSRGSAGGVRVLVRNGSGADRSRFDILGIDDAIFDPDTALKSFKREVAVVGDTPDEDDHLARFVVLQEPLASGKCGWGMVAGITPVQINVADAGEADFADIADGVTSYLTTGASGSAYVLWRNGVGTGTMWAYVLLGTPNWFDSGGAKYQVWQLEDVGGGVLKPSWDYLRMHD